MVWNGSHHRLYLPFYDFYQFVTHVIYTRFRCFTRLHLFCVLLLVYVCFRCIELVNYYHLCVKTSACFRCIGLVNYYHIFVENKCMLALIRCIELVFLVILMNISSRLNSCATSWLWKCMYRHSDWLVNGWVIYWWSTTSMWVVRISVLTSYI